MPSRRTPLIVERRVEQPRGSCIRFYIFAGAVLRGLHLSEASI